MARVYRTRPYRPPTVWRGGNYVGVFFCHLVAGGLGGGATGQSSDAGIFWPTKKIILHARTHFILGLVRNRVQKLSVEPGMLPNAQFELSNHWAERGRSRSSVRACGPFNFEPFFGRHDGTLPNLGQPTGMLAVTRMESNNRGLIVDRRAVNGRRDAQAASRLWRISIPDVTPPPIKLPSHPAT